MSNSHIKSSSLVSFQIASETLLQIKLRHIKYCNQAHSTKDFRLFKSRRSIKYLRQIKLNDQEEDGGETVTTMKLLKILKPYRQYIKGLETPQPSILIYFPHLTNYRISSFEPDLLENFSSRMKIGDMILAQEEPQSLFRSDDFLSTLSISEANSLHIRPYYLSLKALFCGVYFETFTLNFNAIPLSELEEKTFSKLATTILQKLATLKHLKHLRVEFENKSLHFFYAFLNVLNHYPTLLESLQSFKIYPQTETDHLAREVSLPLDTLKSINNAELNGFDIFISENAANLLNLDRLSFRMDEKMDNLANIKLFSNLNVLNIDVNLLSFESKKSFLTSWSLPATIESVTINMTWSTNQVEGEEVEVFEEERELYPDCELFKEFFSKWTGLFALKHLSFAVKKFYKLQSINEAFILPILSKLHNLEVLDYNFKNITGRGFNLPQSSRTTVISFPDLLESLHPSLNQIKIIINDAMMKDFDLKMMEEKFCRWSELYIQANIPMKCDDVVSKLSIENQSVLVYYEIKSLVVRIQSLEDWKELLSSLKLLPSQGSIHLKVDIKDVPLRSFMVGLLTFLKENKKFISLDIHSDYSSPIFLGLRERVIKLSQSNKWVETLKVSGGVDFQNDGNSDMKNYDKLFNVKKFLIN